jgi:hypothetical protein
MDSTERIVHAAVKRVIAENPRATGSRLREALAAADPFSPMSDAALRVIWKSTSRSTFKMLPATQCEPLGTLLCL